MNFDSFGCDAPSATGSSTPCQWGVAQVDWLHVNKGGGGGWGGSVITSSY